MTIDFETIIIGAGAMGSAAAYHLARDNRSVLLLEQFASGHTRGSSHGDSRIIRLAYDHPIYVELARSAYHLWAELESELHRALITTTGGLDMSAPDQPSFKLRVDALQQTGVPFEILDAAEIMRRFPQWHLSEKTVGVYQADSGILNPGECVPLIAEQAMRRGAVLLDQTRVRLIHSIDHGVEVVTDGQSYKCKKLIISAGAWTGSLLKSIGVNLPLVVTQEQFAYYAVHPPADFQPDRFPVFIHYGSGGSFDNYGLPIFGHAGVKVGEHHAGPVVTADTRSFEIDQMRLERLTHYVRMHLPDTTGEAFGVTSCLYTNTPDEHFIIDILPDHPQVIVASPCSGHGFKFSILIGRILADLVERGKTDYPIGMFGLKRFL
ncbi:MAG TPA: N-methyl-L-tryptophan oxidase [Anaerolineae bacterium]|nr:N-methyl-L-tryptophan oxidase [Anaerolineae bacterium]